MRRARLTLLAAIASACSEAPHLLAPASELPPQVQVRVTKHWYPVKGRTVDGIAESLLRDTPDWESLHAAALTTWRVGWGGRTTTHQDVCRLVDVRVNVSVELLLPRWVDSATGTERARLRWEAFEEAVRTHETGHRDVAHGAGVALLETLQKSRDPSCVTLSERARADARVLLERFRTVDRAYDSRTRRGGLQGVVW